MNGHYRWCSWCCNLRHPLCCDCAMCSDCCSCLPPPLPDFCPPQPMPQLPSMGRPPPPTRIIRERVLVPVPYPVYPRQQNCLPSCWVEEPMDNYCQRPQTPLRHEPRQNQGGYNNNPCRRQSPLPPKCFPRPPQDYGGGCDPCGRPEEYRSQEQHDPCQRSRGDSGCSATLGGVLERTHPCPSNCRKRIHKRGQGIIPGYKGHVPGMRFHAAGRSYGQATRDTCCIMSQWGECCPDLPCRIFEQ